MSENKRTFAELLEDKRKLDDEMWDFESERRNHVAKIVEATDPNMNYTGIDWESSTATKFAVTAYNEYREEGKHFYFPVEWLDEDKFDAVAYLEKKKEERRLAQEARKKEEEQRAADEEKRLYETLKAKYEGGQS